MPRITIETLGNSSNRVTEIIEKSYDIPDYIVCPVCNRVCNYSNYQGAYTCDCGFYKKGEQFIKEELGE